MKVLGLRNLGSLRSAEIKPGGSIRLSSGAQIPENTGGEAAWCTLPRELRQCTESCCTKEENIPQVIM